MEKKKCVVVLCLTILVPSFQQMPIWLRLQNVERARNAIANAEAVVSQYLTSPELIMSYNC